LFWTVVAKASSQFTGQVNVLYWKLPPHTIVFVEAMNVLLNNPVAKKFAVATAVSPNGAVIVLLSA
jgi:hypothetical protein